MNFRQTDIRAIKKNFAPSTFILCVTQSLVRSFFCSTLLTQSIWFEMMTFNACKLYPASTVKRSNYMEFYICVFFFSRPSHTHAHNATNTRATCGDKCSHYSQIIYQMIWQFWRFNRLWHVCHVYKCAVNALLIPPPIFWVY